MSGDRDPEVMKAECTLAIRRCLEADPLVLDPFGLACGMFFAGVDAQAAAPRTLAMVEAELVMLRSRADSAEPPKPRRKPDFSGGAYAHDRPRPDPASPARRASDTVAAEITAYLTGAADGPERHREEPGRAPSHDDPPGEVTPCS